jgi:hypothetical protein
MMLTARALCRRSRRPTRGPRQAFPDEVVRLHDEHGVPWPTWYCGPLYTATPADEAHAMTLLLAVRAAAEEASS